MNESLKYQNFIQPSWAPDPWLFGPVWTILYIIIAISFGKVAILYFSKKIKFTIALPFLLNIIFNLLFTPIQFGLQNNTLASIDIFLVPLTLIWAMIAIYPYKKWITYAQIPYLAWVSFATVLQLTITYLNY